MENHPDRGGSEEKIKEINEAYDTLKDADKKAHYDHMRKYGGQNQHGFRSAHGQSPNFEDMFGHNPFGFGGPFMDIEELLRRHRQPQRNRDVNIQYNLTLEEAFTGIDKELTLNFPNGKKTVKVKFPAGVDHGMKIRLQGNGHNDMPNLPPGDLYIHLAIQQHPNFRREANHLRTFVTVDAIDAMLGTEKIIKNIDGSDLKVKIPAAIQYGSALRVQGKGMPVMNSSARGDLYVEVHIQIPTLTDDQRKHLEKVKKSKK